VAPFSTTSSFTDDKSEADAFVKKWEAVNAVEKVKKKEEDDKKAEEAKATSEAAGGEEGEDDDDDAGDYSEEDKEDM